MKKVAFLMLLFAGCGDVGVNGDLVGGSCRDNRDCEEDCLSGKDYPGGMCSVACRDSRDCPNDTVCSNKDGGVCMLLCRYDDDCRRDYDCKSKGLKGEPGEASICVGR